MEEKKNKQPAKPEEENLNRQWQGVDKDPADEKGNSQKVTSDDLKGKKVDADPDKKEDQPSK